MYSVALVGRPNVGKSTLFNRLTEEKDAITSSVSGTTRDRRYGEVLWNGRCFQLIDTGGYLASDEDAFTSGIREQVEAACAEATHILFVVDSQTGVLPMDEMMADMLRRLGKKVWVVANKADHKGFASNAMDFHSLGFGLNMYALSAANGTGTGELLDALVTHIAHMPNAEKNAGLRVALLGRPNVGKSSLLNALLGKERSLVSHVSGTTRDAVDTLMRYHKKTITWVDTAGIRKKAQQAHAIEFYSVLRSLRAMESSDVCVVVVAADEGLCAQDLHVLREAHSKKRGLVLAVNKWDLVEKTTGTYEAYCGRLRRQLGDLRYVPIVFVSAHTKVRLNALVEQALAVYAARKTRISTAQLNRIMGKEVEQSPPPSQKGRIVRIKYLTQVKTASPMFVAFCNRHVQMPVHYTRFLIGRLRYHFGFEGTPIGLKYRSSGHEERN